MLFFDLRMGSDWGTADVRFINSTSDCESVSSPSFNAYRSGASTLNVKNEPLIITFDEIARLGGGYVDVTVSYVEGVESFYVQVIFYTKNVFVSGLIELPLVICSQCE